MRPIFLSPLVCLALACDEPQPAPMPAATTATPTPSVTTSASATIAPVSEKCQKLNQAIWDAAELVPKACKKDDECELAGPGRCVMNNAAFSCMIAIRAGKGKLVNEASDKWKEGGCEGELKTPGSEKIECKAGTCRVTF